MQRFFCTTAFQAAAVPFTRMYRGLTIVWNDRVHRSAEGDAISDEIVDKNLEELRGDGVVKIQHRASVHPGKKEKRHLTGYGLDIFNNIIWTYHFYAGGEMKKWKYVEKEEKGVEGAQNPLEGDGGQGSSTGEIS